MKRYDIYCECETATDVELSPDGEWVKAEVALKMCNSLITIMTLSLWGADLVRSMKEIHDISAETLENAE